MTIYEPGSGVKIYSPDVSIKHFVPEVCFELIKIILTKMVRKYVHVFSDLLPHFSDILAFTYLANFRNQVLF